MGEEVTFEGRHFGVLLRHTSKITAFDPPRHFRDEMIQGQFKSFCHDHCFEPAELGTRMTDILEFESPAGVFGQLFNMLLLTKYLKKLLQTRNAAIKKEAESGPVWS